MAKQEKDGSFNRNPTGKGGFGDHPEHRNVDGAPRKGLSIAEIARGFLEGDEAVTVNGEQRVFNRKLLLLQTAYREAVYGKKAWAFRFLAAYHEGLPPQSVNVTGALFNAGSGDLDPEDEARIEAELAAAFSVPADELYDVSDD